MYNSCMQPPNNVTIYWFDASVLRLWKVAILLQLLSKRLPTIGRNTLPCKCVCGGAAEKTGAFTDLASFPCRLLLKGLGMRLSLHDYTQLVLFCRFVLKKVFCELTKYTVLLLYTL